MTTPSPIEITIKVNASDLMPFLIALLTLRDGGRTPAPPFSSPFSRGFRGFRVTGPFGGPADMVSDIDGLLREVSNLEHLQTLLQILTRESSGEGAEGEPEGEEATGFKGFEEVFDAMEELLRRARATGDDTPPASPPEGPQGSEG